MSQIMKSLMWQLSYVGPGLPSNASHQKYREADGRGDRFSQNNATGDLSELLSEHMIFKLRALPIALVYP